MVNTCVNINFFFLNFFKIQLAFKGKITMNYSFYSTYRSKIYYNVRSKVGRGVNASIL